jgi:predicted TIM-barrel fold metal-dependent hydrolase
MNARLVAVLMVPVGLAVAHAAPPPPMIDMHLHAPLMAEFTALGGRLPLPHCVPMTDLPVPDSGAQWPALFMAPDPPCRALLSPTTDDEVLRRTLAVLERRNIVGVTSGPRSEAWAQAAPDRIMPSLGFGGGPNALTVEAMRERFAARRFAVLGEVTVQYGGIEPDDPSMRPYWALAEEMDIPVGIHIGTGPVGAPYVGPFGRYRARLHSPLLLEEVLIRHPRLRVYIMHAGWPMLDDLLAMLWTHPQLHVDIGVIDWAVPRAEFHRYLQRIVEAGFGKRVMFGSDQMIWPDAIEIAIESVESAPFLSAEQKRDIFYNNAARFLRLSAKQKAQHQRP